MDNINPTHKKLFSLSEASERLNVSIETLIKWNELNILKPTITLEGTIGYTEDQIHHFLEIRQASHLTSPANGASQLQGMNKDNHKVSLENNDGSVRRFDTELTSDFISSHKRDNLSLHNATIIYSRIVNSPMLSAGISFAIIISILTFAFFTRDGSQSGLGSVASIHDSSTTLSSQTSNVKVPQVTAMPTPGVIDDKSTKHENLLSQGENVLKEKLVTKGSLFAKSGFENNDANTLATQQAKPVLASAMSSSDVVEPDLPSRGSMQNDPIFDSTGKIKGEAVDTLTTTLGGIGVLANSMPNQINNSPLNTISLLTLGILSMLFIFPKSLAYTGKGFRTSKHVQEFETTLFPTKIIEVDQKADGTIVLYFQGKEYKISKPELYSESDQFIERLMDLVKPGMKEIEYVVSNDSKMGSKTPLSRLVTRLGFVGIKRDLFFPRTAKDRVYFRKYLTSKDLSDMNLTSDDILLGLQMPN